MLVLHSAMEVVMSASVYLPYACTVLALSSVCFAPELGRRAAGKAAAAVSGLTALVYAVLIILNLSADSKVRHSTHSVTRFFSALEYAAKVDVFEKNDWKVSYLNTCAELDNNNYKRFADRYAEQLMDVPSNSLHQHLISYYLTYQEYDQALRAAKQSVYFNTSDSETWNGCFSLFSSALSQHPEDEAAILDCVRELNTELQGCQERLMLPVVLDAGSKALVAAATFEG